MTYASTADVTARWGRSVDAMEPETVALLEVRLGDVERMIRRRIPDASRQVIWLH